MGAVPNPALNRFIAAIGDELVLAQVRIRRLGSGYELRHEADADLSADSLRSVKPDGARSISQTTATGAFRPLKSAPTLQRGWRMEVANDRELESALNQLYPGAIADWFAAQEGARPVTNFREFTGRQSGMYRITALLTDAQAAGVVRACCNSAFCLKRRLWSVAGLDPDAPGGKSLIPCLEPCAIFMEFARRVMRLEQQEKVRLELAPGEIASLQAALARALADSKTDLREGEVASPDNPRRLQWVLDRLRPFSQLAQEDEGE